MKLQLILCLLFVIYVNGLSNSTSRTFEGFVSKYKKMSKNKSIFNKNLNKSIERQPEILFQLSKLGRESKIAAKTTRLSNKLKKVTKPNKKTTKIPITKGVYQIKSIYNSLKNGQIINNDKNINTIRYIPSVKVDSTKKLYFLFNLSLISGSETLIKTDLFINRKYIKQRLEFNLHYFLYSTFNKRNDNSTTSQKVNRATSGSGSSSATIYLKNLKHEKYLNQHTWQSFNILDSVNSYLSIRNAKQLLENSVNKTLNKNIYYTYNNNLNNQISSLADQPDELVLIMEASNFKSRKSNKNLADILNPYLMVYTKEKETIMNKFFQTRVASSLPDSSNKNDDSLLNLANEDEITQLKNFENQVDKQNESFDSNELNDYITTKSYHLSIMNEANKTNITSKLSSIESYLIEKSKQNDPYFSYLPKEQRMVIKRDLNQRKLSPSFEDLYEEDDEATSVFEDLGNVLNENETKVKNFKCSKQSITIDFEDMSFSDWILEPKRFPSNYCSGICKFPLNQKIAYSNYATLQSILNSISLNNKNTPPELCCSPSITESLPVLYIDKNSVDYVVKLLPDMIVKDCSCR